MLNEDNIQQLEAIYQTDKNEANKRDLCMAIRHINMFESQVTAVKDILSNSFASNRSKITRLFVYTNIMDIRQGMELKRVKY
jgi:hypothetical protein